MSSYWVRTGASTFRPTRHVGGAWQLDEQHIAPALGLLTHLVESERGSALAASRLSFDILGVIPMEEVSALVRVVRPGRTVELVEAELSHAGRPAVLLRAWLMASRDTTDLAGTGLPPLPPPGEMEAWDPTTVWPGGFIEAAEVRRAYDGPGRGRFWVRSDVALVDEPVSALASAAGLFDIANGMAVRADPRAVAFPNVDLTAHLVRPPEPGWLGFDTTVTFGPTGHGLTSSVLHDERGPFGTLAQSLTVRP
ncbi:MAG TPA: thioesterase family protein, partial [Nocardioides sp.]|nr:thioesterase family protein [Nocardioides sp.]